MEYDICFIAMPTWKGLPYLDNVEDAVSMLKANY